MAIIIYYSLGLTYCLDGTPRRPAVLLSSGWYLRKSAIREFDLYWVLLALNGWINCLSLTIRKITFLSFSHARNRIGSGFTWAPSRNSTFSIISCLATTRQNPDRDSAYAGCFCSPHLDLTEGYLWVSACLFPALLSPTSSISCLIHFHIFLYIISTKISIYLALQTITPWPCSDHVGLPPYLSISSNRSDTFIPFIAYQRPLTFTHELRIKLSPRG